MGTDTHTFSSKDFTIYIKPKDETEQPWVKLDTTMSWTATFTTETRWQAFKRKASELLSKARSYIKPYNCPQEQ